MLHAITMNDTYIKVKNKTILIIFVFSLMSGAISILVLFLLISKRLSLNLFSQIICHYNRWSLVKLIENLSPVWDWYSVAKCKNFCIRLEVCNSHMSNKIEFYPRYSCKSRLIEFRLVELICSKNAWKDFIEII